VKVSRASEYALVLAYEGEATLERQERIWALAAQARSEAAILEAVPGMNNLTLFLRDPQADADTLAARLLAATAAAGPAAAEAAPRSVEIPVCYGGDAGPDLPEVAELCGLAPDEVVRAHAGALYVVYFLGFTPGFAYLGGLDPRISVPRRATARTRVPAGSVGIGGAQTGIYPRQGPGGWHLIGRTEIALFDWRNAPPALLRAGDRVRFVPQ
jgi:KipI family sensor histidine kinase inhibitor